MPYLLMTVALFLIACDSSDSNDSSQKAGTQSPDQIVGGDRSNGDKTPEGNNSTVDKDATNDEVEPPKPKNCGQTGSVGSVPTCDCGDMHVYNHKTDRCDLADTTDCALCVAPGVAPGEDESSSSAHEAYQECRINRTAQQIENENKGLCPVYTAPSVR